MDATKNILASDYFSITGDLPAPYAGICYDYLLLDSSTNAAISPLPTYLSFTSTTLSVLRGSTQNLIGSATETVPHNLKLVARKKYTGASEASVVITLNIYHECKTPTASITLKAASYTYDKTTTIDSTGITIPVESSLTFDNTLISYTDAPGTIALCISYKWETISNQALPDASKMPYFSTYGPTTLTLSTGGPKFTNPLSKTA